LGRFTSTMIGGIMDVVRIRIIKHEIVPGSGSYEVRFPDGGPSKYFYFENLPSRRLRPGLVEQSAAELAAKAYARAAQAKLDLR
jgi:hypothetical protein